MKKRIIVAIADKLGCGWYRMAMPYKEASGHGFDVLLTNCFNGLILSPENDVLVLQRQHSDAVMNYAQEFKNLGGKIVSEVDDYLHGIPANNPASKAYPKNGKELKNFETIMKMSDLMTVSTPHLAEKYSEFCKNVQVCYNALDISYFKDFKKEFHKNGVVRIGWAGSSTHHDDLMLIVKPMTEIMQEYLNVQFVFVGADYRKFFPPELQPRIIHAGHTFPMHKGKALFVNPDGQNPVHQYYDLLKSANIDIALAPIVSVPFNKSKSFIKILEYSICKIPFVASNFGPYSEFVKNRYGWYRKEDSIGFLADRNPEWKKYIKALINDKSLCETMAENNYRNAVENHDIKNGVQQWLNALATIGVFPSQEKGSYEENIVKD